MKVQRMLSETEVLVLVDGGSTHNFISDVLVNELKLSTRFVSPFGVQIRNGDVIRCNQVCKDLNLRVKELEIVQDFYPFSLGGADLVLGILWLATLDTVQAKWREMSVIFNLNSKKYKLQGISSGPHKSSSFQHLAADPKVHQVIPSPLLSMVQSFNQVFHEPTSLPPFRTHFHSIPLLSYSSPPNIRPYHYPYSQKAEIEKQVEELLAV